MIPRNTSKTIRTHKNIRTMRSLFTNVGPNRGRWARLRETEDLHRRLHPVYPQPVAKAPHH